MQALWESPTCPVPAKAGLYKEPLNIITVRKPLAIFTSPSESRQHNKCWQANFSVKPHHLISSERCIPTKQMNIRTTILSLAHAMLRRSHVTVLHQGSCDWKYTLSQYAHTVKLMTVQEDVAGPYTASFYDWQPLLPNLHLIIGPATPVPRQHLHPNRSYRPQRRFGM